MTDLDAARRLTVERLVEALARDHLDLQEFERRVAGARAAGTRDELRALVEILPGRGATR